MPTTLEKAFSLARITEARFEAIAHKEKATAKKEQSINETTNTITSLQSEVASLEAKGEALETTSKDLEKKMIDLNLTLHDLQEVKTKCALKIDDEEFKKAKSEATRKITKLSKVYGAWLPPWIASRLVVYQPYVKNY
ncbi:hypothetical protein Tco_1165452 [Tanacetum coccineum]